MSCFFYSGGFFKYYEIVVEISLSHFSITRKTTYKKFKLYEQNNNIERKKPN